MAAQINTKAETLPTIVENYRDYSPPPKVRQIIHDLLKTVPPRYLVGLETVVVTNQAGETRDRKRQKVWSRNRKIKLADALGYYSAATRSSRASIVLRIDRILQGVYPAELKTPLLRYVPVAKDLYHEIGHHIHAEHKPVFKGPEDVADDWSGKLSALFFRKHYWYLAPVFYPLRVSVKIWRRLSKRT